MRAAALALLVAGAATVDGPSARDRLGAGLLAESLDGDYAAAALAYASVAEDAAAPDHLRAEALVRLGLAQERSGDDAAAQATYERTLAAHPSSRWADEARSRLQALDEDRRRVASLPLRFDFEADTEGLFHARTRAHKGTLGWERTEDGAGVAAWRTYVAAREDDWLQIGFAPGAGGLGQLLATVRSVGFPLHLSVALVDADGRRFSTVTEVVRPEEGWRALAFDAADFRDRSGGADAPYAGQPVTTLWLQDMTGYASTDRGDNVLQIDALQLR